MRVTRPWETFLMILRLPDRSGGDDEVRGCKIGCTRCGGGKWMF